ATALAGATGGAGPVHRVLAALAGPPLAALLVAALVSHRRLLAPVVATGVLLLATSLAPGAAHLALAIPAFASAAVLAALTWRGHPVPAGAWRDYLTLTKPRVMTLLLLTGVCGAAVGAHGRPSATLLATTFFGLVLACGGAAALNHVLDRDIDKLMGPRTAARPV